MDICLPFNSQYNIFLLNELRSFQSWIILDATEYERILSKFFIKKGCNLSVQPFTNDKPVLPEQGL